MKLPFVRSASKDLTDSTLFNERTFYERLLKDVGTCRQELIIESPFLTTRRVKQLLPYLHKLTIKGVRITINTRHPNEHDIYLKGEAKIAISLLQEIGVTILTTGGHHRKLAIIDRSILWEGSLNILSHNQSCEIMRRISSDKMANEMLKFINLKRHLN